MARVRVDAGHIGDWGSFHRVFREAMGFPGSHGEDMDAWIECMRELTRAAARPGGLLVVEVARSIGFRGRCPEQFAELVEAAAYVNHRYEEEGLPPPLTLLFLRDTPCPHEPDPS
jgi:RNAse (barnase) inhibitor barstar